MVRLAGLLQPRDTQQQIPFLLHMSPSELITAVGSCVTRAKPRSPSRALRLNRLPLWAAA